MVIADTCFGGNSGHRECAHELRGGVLVLKHNYCLCEPGLGIPVSHSNITAQVNKLFSSSVLSCP
jgi:hypothetical protein